MPGTYADFYEVQIAPSLEVYVTFRAQITFQDAANYTIDDLEARTTGKSPFSAVAWTSIPREHPLWIACNDYANSPAGCREICRSIEYEIEEAGGLREVYRMAAE